MAAGTVNSNGEMSWATAKAPSKGKKAASGGRVAGDFGPGNNHQGYQRDITTPATGFACTHGLRLSNSQARALIVSAMARPNRQQQQYNPKQFFQRSPSPAEICASRCSPESGTAPNASGMAIPVSLSQGARFADSNGAEYPAARLIQTQPPPVFHRGQEVQGPRARGGSISLPVCSATEYQNRLGSANQPH